MKIIPCLVLILSLFVLSSCSSNDPEKVAVDAVKCMLDKDFEELFEYFEIPENLSEEELKEYKEELLKKIERVRQSKTEYQQIDEHGGAHKIQVVKNSDGSTVEYLTEKKDKVRVYIEVICKDGEKINIGSDKFVLRDGKWKAIP